MRNENSRSALYGAIKRKSNLEIDPKKLLFQETENIRLCLKHGKSELDEAVILKICALMRLNFLEIYARLEEIEEKLK